MKAQLRYGISVFALLIIYGLSIAISVVGKLFRSAKRKPRHRVIVNGTFHNLHWFYAHISPLIQSDYGEIILVTDEPLAEMKNLRNVCPPIWAQKCFSRAGAKALWTFAMGVKYPADCFMGYHIFPSSITALICARLTGAKAIYQITSGSVELEGGGWRAENPLLAGLQKPSAFFEKLALKVTNHFDMVIVRGTNAKNFLLSRYITLPQIEVVTGSVVTNANLMQADEQRTIDALFVGRLAETKRPDRFVNSIAKVCERLPECRAVVVGDGPQMSELKALAEELKLGERLEFWGQRKDVPEIQGRAKTFVLTSRSEGVSIAMLESMGLGCVPVVSDVGDLADFVTNNETGFILPQDDIDGFADALVTLLSEMDTRQRIAQAARERVLNTADRETVARRWSVLLKGLRGKV